MKKLTLENIMYVIVDLVPEFKAYKDFGVWNIDDVTERNGLLDIFGRFLVERVENYDGKDSIVPRIYQFLNEQFNESNSDLDALDYLGIEIFENLSSSKKCTEISREFLTGKALESFNETAKYF